MKVFRRDLLLKLAKEDKLVLINMYSAEGEEEVVRLRNVAIPVKVETNSNMADEEGFQYLPESDFKRSSGRAWENVDETITLKVHRDRSMTFKVVG